MTEPVTDWLQTGTLAEFDARLITFTGFFVDRLTNLTGPAADRLTTLPDVRNLTGLVELGTTFTKLDVERSTLFTGVVFDLPITFVELGAN